MCCTKGEMIDVRDVVKYHIKHPKSIVLNQNVFLYYFSYLLENFHCSVLTGYYKEDISYADIKSSSCLFYQDTTKAFILWALTIALKQMVYTKLHYFIFCHQTYYNILQDLNLHPSWRTEDNSSCSCFYLDKGLTTCMQSSNVGNRRYNSDNDSSFSEFHKNR